MIVREADVTLKDTMFGGDLIIGQGVGDGDVTLDNVTVTGTLVVYGGGSHSVNVTGGSQIRYVVVNKQGGEPANIRVENGSRVSAVEINAGNGGNTTPSALTLEELRNALENPAVAAINVSGDLINYGADITIPSGKTVVLLQNAGLRVRNLTVDGTLIGNAGAVLRAGTSLSGAGLNPGRENGFFGTDASYRPLFPAWYTEDAGAETTGWWPTSVVVTTETALTEALAVSTVGQVLPMGDFVINNSFTVNSLQLEDSEAHTIITPGAIVTTGRVVLWGSLTVHGMLKGSSADAKIYLYGGSELNLNGIVVKGPAVQHFSLGSVARVLEWDGSAWGVPYLYNVNTGNRSLYAEGVTATTDIGYLASAYPELAGIHLYGAYDRSNGFSFDNNYSIDVSVPVLIHGNQTFGFGDDAYTLDPVVIGAGVTLTVKNGAGEVRLVVDDPTKNAIVGTDNTSRIVVESGATVLNSYQDSNAPAQWVPGTYVWNGNAWIKQ